MPLREYKKQSILLLQTIIVLIGIAALVVLIRFPLTEGRAVNLDLLSVYADPFILYGYSASVPFFIGLYKLLRLLGYIGKKELISQSSVSALRSINYCAIAACIFIVIAGIYIRIFHNEEEDPAGFLVICLLTGLVSLVVAIAAARFERYLRKPSKGAKSWSVDTCPKLQALDRQSKKYNRLWKYREKKRVN